MVGTEVCRHGHRVAVKVGRGGNRLLKKHGGVDAVHGLVQLSRFQVEAGARPTVAPFLGIVVGRTS